MIYIPLITPEQVKANTEIQENVDSESLRKYIKAAQMQKIEPLLGKELKEALYNRVQELAAATPEAPAPQAEELDALLGLIEEPLALWTFCKAAHFLEIKVTEKGFKRKLSQQSEAVEITDIGRICKLAEEDAIFYTGVLQQFLQDNATTYAQYGTQVQQEQQQSSGLYIPDYEHNPNKYPEWQ
jgi:hypothetical protein